MSWVLTLWALVIGCAFYFNRVSYPKGRVGFITIDGEETIVHVIGNPEWTEGYAIVPVQYYTIGNKVREKTQFLRWNTVNSLRLNPEWNESDIIV